MVIDKLKAELTEKTIQSTNLQDGLTRSEEACYGKSKKMDKDLATIYRAMESWRPIWSGLQWILKQIALFMTKSILA